MSIQSLTYSICCEVNEARRLTRIAKAKAAKYGGSALSSDDKSIKATTAFLHDLLNDLENIFALLLCVVYLLFDTFDMYDGCCVGLVLCRRGDG